MFNFNFKFNKKGLFSNFRNRNTSNNNRSSRFIGEYRVLKQEEIYDFLKEDVCIIDVRTENEFRGLRVKEAINIPLMVLSRDIKSVVPDTSTKILVYCTTGERAMLAIQKLNSLGYRNIYIWGNGGLNTLKYKDILEY